MRLLGLLIFILIFQMACEENSPEIQTYTFAISADSLGFTLERGILELDVMSDNLWTVVDTSAWLSVHGDSLSGMGKLTVTVAENKNEQDRSSTVFIYAGSHELKLKIYQQAFIHPALMPLNLAPLKVIEGNETFVSLINTPELSISEISKCGDQPSSNSHNVVLLGNNTSHISVTWNHIASTSGEWEGISKSSSSYNLTYKLNNKDEACSSVSTYNGILVKKYGDWDHQHANGFFLAPVEQNVYMLGLDKIMIDFYYDLSLTHIPSKEELSAAYGLNGNELLNWDKGLFNFDIQLHTKENNHAAFNLSLDPSFGNKWLRIEIPVAKLQCWNSANSSISFTSMSRHQLVNISLTAETGNRLVYRNINQTDFNANTPKLFKEIGFRIKRFELVRKEEE